MSTLLPVYYQIKHTVKNWILNKEFVPSQKIPSENELADMFKVSKMTVRHAISQLVQEGFLTRKRGAGTFVAENIDLIDSLSIEFTGYMNEIFWQVQKAKTKSVVMKHLKASNLIRTKLGLPEKDKAVLQIKLIRFFEDKPFNYATNYLPVKIGSKITERALYRKPLLQIIQQDLNIPLTEAYQTTEASFSDHEVSQALGIPSGSPMLFVERIMYTTNRKPVSMLQVFYRGDMFKYITRFKNIKRKKKEKDIWVYHDELTHNPKTD
ncbi:MAG: GntR family transcriptional regulator [Deltaproteobacteria bacterium]|nr:GntR family transcriptional regulator [Deltaproteobacteria bacterium]